jgi:hypothetical protein
MNAICKCQNCSGEISFDRAYAGQTTQCPLCNLETILFVPAVAAPPAAAIPAYEIKPQKKWSPFYLLAGSITFAVFFLLWFIFSLRDDTVGSALATGCIGGAMTTASFALYFLPYLIARLNKKTNVDAILLLNLFLGWSLIGWVVALVWAAMKEPKRA